MNTLKEKYQAAFIEQNKLKEDHYLVGLEKDNKKIELYIPKTVDYLNNKSNYNKFISRFLKYISLTTDKKDFHIKINGKNRNFTVHSISFNGILFVDKHYKLKHKL